MDVLEAIHNRRTIHAWRPDPIPREQLEQILAAAVMAPNHKLTNPWEFYVVSGAAKEKLARLRGELKRSKAADPTSEKARQGYDRAYGEMATVPYAVLVCQRVAGDPVRDAEDLMAVACSIQNLMLAARAAGIGSFWGSGPLLRHEETLRTLGVPEGQLPVGLIFLGYPDHEPAAPARNPVAQHTHWVE